MKHGCTCWISLLLNAAAFLKTGAKASVSSVQPQPNPSGPPAPPPWQDISISCGITITPLFSLSLSTSMAALRGESMWELQTLPPPLPPLMYWPALARWDGPLAARQRHVTLEGQWAAIPHPYCSSVHIMQRNLWPHILHPTPHNFSSRLCWSRKVGCAWAWVAGAEILTFHFSRSDLVTFGRRASVVPPPPHFAPNCRASYNAKHVESF